MSARTSGELAARRLQLVQPAIAPDHRQQAAVDYLHAMATAPALVRWWSWVVSLARDGVRPGQVREALAAALSGDFASVVHGGLPPIRGDVDDLFLWDGDHDIERIWNEDTGDVVERRCSCGETWTYDRDICPDDPTSEDR